MNSQWLSDDMAAGLARADSRGLRYIAAAYRKTADAIEAEADRREQREAMRAEAEANRDRLRRLPRDHATYVAAGWSHADALRRVAEDHGMPEDTVALHVREAQRQRDHAARQARDAEIARLAAAGWTRTAIAQRMAVSPSTVTRAVRTARHNQRTATPGLPGWW